jgi:DNA-binding NtrC family response regulator
MSMVSPAPKILIVDDEPAICRNCVKILSRGNYEVAYALNGMDALAMLAEEPRDVVITDLKMSRMGGMEVLSRIKEHMPDTLVIVITGYSTVSSAVEVMKLGAFDYLPKPFTPEELRAVVEQAINAVNIRKQLHTLDTLPKSVGPVSHQLVGSSPKIQKVVNMIAKVAPTNATVLINGESGTGKELVARAVHANSMRSDKVFFAVDCGTLSGNLLESELFGHAKGAFTGADKAKEGIFQRAEGGTVFLDEIGNINLEVQGKLLRFLESREYLPLGDPGTPRKVDIRLIMATNQNLEEMVAEGRFREDFYYRIYVYPILLPPLRARREDILPIAYHFVSQFSKQMGKPIEGFEPKAAQALGTFDWPGNVRQLRNVIERAVIQCEGGRIGPKELTLDGIAGELEDLLAQVPRTNEELKQVKQTIRQKSVAQIEKKFILNALAQTQWNVTQAAKMVGLQRSNFQNMMRKHGVRRPTDGGSARVRN